MQGYVVAKGDRFYVVIYEGVDPITGRERRRWHAAGGLDAVLHPGRCVHGLHDARLVDREHHARRRQIPVRVLVPV